MDKGNDNGVLDEWSKKEQENESRIGQDQLLEEVRAETNPSRQGMHKFFNFISLVVILAAINMAVGQFVGMKFETVGPIQYVLRIYVIVLCLLVILVELEWTRFARESFILRMWITRGLFYAFIGILGLEENDTSTKKGSSHTSISLNYIKAVAWVMVVCGTLYFFMGAFCLQIYYNRMRKDYEERLEHARHVRQSAISRLDDGNAV